MATVTLVIKGMSCQHCVASVKSALLGVKGVTQAAVDLQAEKAYVTYNEGEASADAMKRAVEEQGFEVG